MPASDLLRTCLLLPACRWILSDRGSLFAASCLVSSLPLLPFRVVLFAVSLPGRFLLALRTTVNGELPAFKDCATDRARVRLQRVAPGELYRHFLDWFHHTATPFRLFVTVNIITSTAWGVKRR